MFDYKFSLPAAAGVSRDINARGRSVFYYEETTGAVDAAVIVTALGGEGGSFELRPGEGVRMPNSSTGFKVTNISGASVLEGVLKIGDGDFAGKNIAGSVSVANQPEVSGAFTHDDVTVTNVSAVIVAANASRRYLMVQNRDAVGIIYVRVDGAVATAATGIKLGPDEAVIFEGFAPVGEVRAIGDIANNPNVLVVEG